jgi:hypothetical protein
MAIALEKNPNSMTDHASTNDRASTFDHSNRNDRAESAGMEPAAGGQLASSPVQDDREPRPARVITTKPQVALSDQELRARVQWAHRASSHFQIAYDRTAFSEIRAAMLNESLEIAYTLIFHFTHESFTDRFQVYAVDQRATGLLGRSVWPHFNLEERAMYLVESGSRSVHSELAGLLTHAMRLSRYARHYHATPGWAVLEEGFGLFLSERLSTQPDLFPFYGAEPDIIAHHLYRKHELHLPAIWNISPYELKIQERILAGAFMLYLGDTFSDDRVVTFSKSDDAITDETFRTFFGASLSDLEAIWIHHLPLSLVTLTEEEQSAMVQHWDRSIESSCR